MSRFKRRKYGALLISMRISKSMTKVIERFPLTVGSWHGSCLKVKEVRVMREGYVQELSYYLEKYCKRKSDPWNLWVLRCRSVMSAWGVIEKLRDLEFEEVCRYTYFKYIGEAEDAINKFLGFQLEEAVLSKDRFVGNLFEASMNLASLISENKWYRNLFELREGIWSRFDHGKIEKTEDKVLNSYATLLNSVIECLAKDNIKKCIVGLTEDGELIFGEHPYPFIDVPGHMLASYLKKSIRSIYDSVSEKEINRVYSEYGYDFIHTIDDAKSYEAVVQVFDANVTQMCPYVNEYNMEVTIKDCYKQKPVALPRKWRNTEVYKEALKRRSYMLPATGITAEYVNAGDITKIYFAEVIKNDEVVLLYKVTTKVSGEFSGFYRTKTQLFYSIFDYSNQQESHYDLENFILENYMILTCDYVIDKKKNYAIAQSDDIYHDFHYPYQPLVSYTYKLPQKKTSVGSGKRRKYVKEEYQEELRTRSGYIRRLPEGQNASDEARERAEALGLFLPDGRTFVRSHEYHVYTKINMVAES